MGGWVGGGGGVGGKAHHMEEGAHLTAVDHQEAHTTRQEDLVEDHAEGPAEECQAEILQVVRGDSQAMTMVGVQCQAPMIPGQVRMCNGIIVRTGQAFTKER